MDFADALKQLKNGETTAIKRSVWNGSGFLVKLQRPDSNSEMSLPYLYIEYPLDAKNTTDSRCPWLASQTDILADDWGVV